MLAQRSSEASSGWGGASPNGTEFAVELAGFLLLAVLLTVVVSGLVVVIVEHRRNRTKTLADREAETFAAAVVAGDFDAAERSIRWALALAPRTDPAVGAEPIA